MRFIIMIHRILGTAFSILFLMWFLTGIVMIYHHYPSLSGDDALRYRCEGEGRAVLPLDSIMSAAAVPADSVTEMQVTVMPGTTLLNVRRGAEELLYDCHSGQKIERLQKPALERVAQSWCDAKIMDVDSLNEIDVWLIGAYPFKEYPVYKYVFDVEDKTEPYLSSRTGRGLQLTTSESRMWAWLGAIPHWIYIKQLRANGRQPWTDVVLWISGFGILMTLSGIIVGLRSMILARRQRKLCPYRKPMFRWHHISGLVFGLFVLTFIFSGFMSLQKIPTSLVPYNEDYAAESFFRGQVFITPSGDHYRTRLTHTLEVNQIAKTIGKALRLNEDLIEAIALGHDVGHTPFAHTGEEVLDKLMPGGFRHNVNSVRVLERIEQHKGLPGLNISAEVLDGILYHSGYGSSRKCAATLEGQIIRFSDKIAYVQHDIDDSIRAGVLRESDLPAQYTNILGHSHGERITTLVTDLVQHTRKQMAQATDRKELQISLTDPVDEALKGLRSYMFEHVYQGSVCELERKRATLVVQYLFDHYCSHPEQMPELYQQIAQEEGIEQGVCDYISGMSDAYCIAAFKEITIPRSFI